MSDGTEYKQGRGIYSLGHSNVSAESFVQKLLDRRIKEAISRRSEQPCEHSPLWKE